MSPRPKILVPTDFSEAAAGALNEAIVLGRLTSRGLMLLHVVSPTPYLPAHALLLAAGAHDPRPATDVARNQARFKLKKLAERVQPLTGQLPEIRVEFGSPEELICTLAEEAACAFIVLGSRSTEPGAGDLGSVAKRVLRRAPCPVMLVRRPGHPALLSAAAASLF